MGALITGHRLQAMRVRRAVRDILVPGERRTASPPPDHAVQDNIGMAVPAPLVRQDIDALDFLMSQYPVYQMGMVVRNAGPEPIARPAHPVVQHAGPERSVGQGHPHARRVQVGPSTVGLGHRRAA